MQHPSKGGAPDRRRQHGQRRGQAQRRDEARHGQRERSPFEHPDTGEDEWVEHYPLTRGIRNRAMEAASLAFQEQHGQPGFSPTVLEEELVDRLVRDWSLDAEPTKQGWRNLTSMALCDLVADVIGVNEAMRSLQGPGSEEVQRAKN